jgi:hypothetical protein
MEQRVREWLIVVLGSIELATQQVDDRFLADEIAESRGRPRHGGLRRS